MTIFLNLYILIYLLSLIKINYLLSNYLFNESNTFSLPAMMTYILKFNKLKNIIYLLLISLTGLPPFIMFFIKFNYLINILYKFNIFLVLIIFLIFFLNMLFYIQLFFNKNEKITLLLKKGKKKTFNFTDLYFITFFIFLNFLSVLLFSDLFYIFKLIISGNI